ncbi:ribosome recycling factor [Candidatus Acetothermia bacterium]|jgi:ribosome recycling factor|nr:ribosome recycling factor [Candidatus Acetothermia bacterium]
MLEDILTTLHDQMKHNIITLKEGLAKIQTGRANPMMIEDITVDYYGTSVPLRELGNITTPDPSLLAIHPYDKTQMAAMEKAILAADLGLNPANDGMIIRIKIPKLSEQRRTELVKIIKKRGEETKVALRNIRREVNENLNALKKEKQLSEDDYHRYREQIDRDIHSYSDQIDKIVEQKQAQLRTI